MKSFIKKTLFFILPLIVLSYPLDRYISSCLNNSNGYDGELEVWNDIYKGKLKNDILIYGSSRAWVEISPMILRDSLNANIYNLGMDGHNFWLQYLRHLEYLKYNEKPKQIILTVDFGSFQKRNDLYLYEQFLPHMLWNENIRQFTKSYEGFKYFDYNIPMLRYIGHPKVITNAMSTHFNNESHKEHRTLGYKGLKREWRHLDYILNHNNAVRFNKELDVASINLFNDFLLECQNNNIQVILVYTPEYYDSQRFLKMREPSIKIFKTMSQKYNIHFLDYSNNNITRDKSYFYNATHLNKNGSELFSKLLAHDLIKNKIIMK